MDFNKISDALLGIMIKVERAAILTSDTNENFVSQPILKKDDLVKFSDPWRNIAYTKLEIATENSEEAYSELEALHEELSEHWKKFNIQSDIKKTIISMLDGVEDEKILDDILKKLCTAAHNEKKCSRVCSRPQMG